MKAALLRKPGDLVVADVPHPPMRPDEVLVKVSDCGICGSDIRYHHGDNPWSKETLGVYIQPPPNIILGHEVAGVVVDAGPEARKDLIGKRAGVLSFEVDGTCYWCRRGMHHLCPNTVHLGHSAGWGKQDYYYGGMAEYVAVWSDHCYPLPDNVSNESASLLDPLCVAVHGVRKSGMRAGDTVLVTGGGPIGAFTVQVARAMGAGAVVQTEIDDRILEVGKKLGASISINVEKQDLKQAVLEVTSGRGAAVILDTVGRPLSELMALLSRGGRLVTYAVQEREELFSTMSMSGERSISSTANFEFPDFQTGLDMLASGAVNAEATVTHRFPLSQAPEAFSTAGRKGETGAVKVVLKIPD